MMQLLNQPPASWNDSHDGRLREMIRIAHSAGQHTLKYFRSSDLVVDAKSDASPVTVADREAERLVRSMVADAFPDDTVQGEEFAEHAGSSPYRWIVDPIDGTKSFVCGVALYSTLLALECDDEPVGGVIYIPAGGEMIVAAAGQGSWYRSTDDGDWRRAQVSTKSELAEAVFVVSQVDSFDDRGAGSAYKRIEADAWLTRSWGDGYGYLMVATGRADIMIDPICNAWDVAAILPILQEAGGRFTDWQGNATTRGGDGVGTNGRLHDAVLAKLVL